MSKVHFITYGSHEYEETLKRIEEEANNSNFFDSIKVYHGQETLTKDFREKLTSLIEEKNSISRNFLNLKEIKKIMMNDKNERFYFIKWSLFNLETWRKQNFLQNKL